jgi:diguanylate cyclase (GGDEF)-like protein
MRLLPGDSRVPASGISLTDRITRLYNRQGFIFAGSHLLQGTSPSERWAFLLSLEVNHWKVVNQVLGGEAADNFLMQTAASLRKVFRRSAVIGRVGVDRFAVLARVENPAACTALFGRLTDPAEGMSPVIDGLELSLRGGFTQFDAQSPVSIPHLLQNADARMNAIALEPSARNR